MITATAPVRICDNGGWTDTWFGGPGRVFDLAVTPGIEVSIAAAGGPDPVVLSVDTFGDRYVVEPGATRLARHPLLEAAIDAYPPPPGAPVEIRVRAAVPAGCGTGTSAAVVVALLGALAALRSEHPSAHRVAYEAHHLEVDVLGRQSGIQDHLSAAYGGMIFLEVDQYPRATVTRLPLWAALGDLLSLVYLGRAHDSSAVHRDVIAGAASRGATLFSALRAAAVASCEAVRARDLAAFGRAMIANTDAQDALHPSLVGADARRVIRTATAGGALGWKVNGAGGDGGSVTVLSPSPQAKQAFERQVTATARWRVLPFRVSPGGLHVEGALP